MDEPLNNDGPKDAPAPQTPPTPPPQTEHPIADWFHKLVHGDPNQSPLERAGEVARSVGRGVVSAVQEGANTIAEGAAYVDRKTGLGERLTPGYNSAYDEAGASALAAPATQGIQDAKTAVFGKKTDDPLANFAESASQFAAGFAGAGELKLLKAGKSLKELGAAGVVLRAGLTDGTLFKPYEAGLAELAARAPVPIVKQLGELLSVKGDDGPIVARLKRAGASVISMTALESVVAGVRAIRASKALADPAASAAEKATAQETVAASSKTLESASDGTLVPEGAHVVPVENADGTYSIKQVEGSPLPKVDDVESPKFADKAEAETQAASANGAIEEHLNAGKPIPEEVLKDIPEDPIKLAAYSEAPEIDTSIHDTPEQTVARVKQIADLFEERKAASMASDNTYSTKDAKQAAHDALKLIPTDAAHAVINQGLRTSGTAQASWSQAADLLLQAKGTKITKLLDGFEARPHDPILAEQLRTAVEQHAETRHILYETESDSARRLRFVQERDDIRSQGVQFLEDVTAAKAEAAKAPKPEPVEGETPVAPKETPSVKAEDAPEPKSPVTDFAKGAGPMTDDEAQSYARMVRMSGPLAPRNAEAIAQATQIQRDTGSMAKGMEYYVNNLLSGPKTMLTVLNSAAVMSHFEPLVRALGGVMTGNGALAREGADILYGNYKYFSENVSSALMAFREGRAITNPLPVHNAIDGTLGTLIRIPGRVLTGLHEFATVTNYRSFIRATSLRAGRAAGLEGDALSQYVDKDLSVAFDSKTGIGTIPQGISYAQGATFTKGLGNGTFGAAYQDLANNAWQVKMITPFVKISTNILKYGKSLTPWDLATNLYSGAKGGFDEETQVNLARATLGSSMYATGMYAAHADLLTGSGPRDPDLRKMWLATHQPYSVKVGDNWISYQRIEPFSTMLGIIADVTETFHESEEQSGASEKIGYSLFSGITKDITNKTYMQGLARFFDAASSGREKDMQAFVQTVSNGLVPFGSLLNQMNPDDTYRNVRSTLDNLRSRIPGLSETLDPAFNSFGEPTLKAPWFANRSLNIATVKPTNPNAVENQLLDLGKGLAPYPQQLKGTNINLSDRDTYDNGTGVSPYARMMQYVRDPKNGGPSLREAMETLVKSDRWKNASGTVQTDDFTNTGGLKLTLSAAVKTQYEDKALAAVMSEYPKLKDAWTAAQRAKAAALGGGPDAQERVSAILNKAK